MDPARQICHQYAHINSQTLRVIGDSTQQTWHTTAATGQHLGCTSQALQERHSSTPCYMAGVHVQGGQTATVILIYGTNITVPSAM